MQNTETGSPNRAEQTAGNSTPLLIVSWLWVGLPLAWGVYQTFLKSLALFK
jgi:hypothetical protein